MLLARCMDIMQKKEENMTELYVITIILLFLFLYLSHDKYGGVYLHPLVLIPILSYGFYLFGGVEAVDAIILYAIMIIFYKILKFFKFRYENNKTRKTYYENGRLESVEPYLNGKRNGVCIRYYMSGQTESEETYQNGYKNGTSRYYYENGQLESEQNYTSEYLDGEIKKYYENGALKCQAKYNNNKKDGVCAFYHQNGNPALVAQCKNDRIYGALKIYDMRGKMILDVTLNGNSFAVYFYVNERNIETSIESICIGSGLVDIGLYEKAYGKRCDIGQRCYYKYSTEGILKAVSKYNGREKIDTDELFDDNGEHIVNEK